MVVVVVVVVVMVVVVVVVVVVVGGGGGCGGWAAKTVTPSHGEPYELPKIGPGLAHEIWIVWLGGRNNLNLASEAPSGGWMNQMCTFRGRVGENPSRNLAGCTVSCTAVLRNCHDHQRH